MHAHPTIDSKASQLWLARAPTQSPWLHTEVARRMQERLDWITLTPHDILHWGSVYGDWNSVAALHRRYPKARNWVLEQTPAHFAWAQNALQPQWWQRMVHKATAQVVHWPENSENAKPTILPDAVDMIWCNMLLHQLANPWALLQRFAQLLRPSGMLMFSCLGPDTLQTLRTIYAKQGWGEPHHAFTDMHDWGDGLVQCGFEGPVMDMEHIVLRYTSPQRALQELRELGKNLSPERFAGCRGRGWHAQLLDALQTPVELEFEIIYGHALWPTHPKITMQATTHVSMQDMREQLGGVNNWSNNRRKWSNLLIKRLSKVSRMLLRDEQ